MAKREERVVDKTEEERECMEGKKRNGADARFLT